MAKCLLNHWGLQPSNCARIVPILRLVESVEFSSRLLNVHFVRDVVAIKDTAGLVPADTHGDSFGDPGSNHVAYGCSAKVMKYPPF